MKKLQTFLWFVDNAEEAMAFYVSLFPNSRIVSVSRIGDNVPGPQGKQIIGEFELMGQSYMCINGGPLPESMKGQGPMSLVVPCDTQEELDRLWDAFSAGGGKPIQCGWITDRFGTTWQVTPSIIGELMGDPDPEKARRTAEAMMKMVKFDIAELKRAHDGA
jgi:predicted 3-demethylubiquinone-9 3-methyltransferase (glyoxalase superfamily)